MSRTFPARPVLGLIQVYGAYIVKSIILDQLVFLEPATNNAGIFSLSGSVRRHGHLLSFFIAFILIVPLYDVHNLEHPNYS